MRKTTFILLLILLIPLIPSTPAHATIALQDNNFYGDNNPAYKADFGDLTDNIPGRIDWCSQIITPSTSYSASIISLKLERGAGGGGGTIYVGIRATSAGLPTGSDLSTGTISDSVVTTRAWYNVTLSSPVSLTAGTSYAVVVRCSDGSAFYQRGYYWDCDTVAPYGYPEPGLYSMNAGGTWNNYNYVFMFAVYGGSSPSVNNTLTIQAPVWQRIHEPRHRGTHIRKYINRVRDGLPAGRVHLHELVTGRSSLY